MTKDRPASYIGGRDAATLVGANDYQTPTDIYLRLTGAVEYRREPLEEIEGVLRRGLVLEPLVRDEYMRITGRKVRRVNIAGDGFVRHPEKPYIAGHVDGEIIGDPRGVGILEIKTSRPEVFAKVKKHGVKGDALAQCLHYQIAAGREWGEIIYLEPLSWETRIFTVDARESREVAQLREEIELACYGFWSGHVVPRIMPTSAVSRDKFPTVVESEITLTKDDVYLVLMKRLLEAEEIKADADEFVADTMSALNAFMTTSKISAAEGATVIDGVVRRLRYYYRKESGRRSLRQKDLIAWILDVVNKAKNVIAASDAMHEAKAAGRRSDSDQVFKLLFKLLADTVGVIDDLTKFDKESFYKVGEPKLTPRRYWIKATGDEPKRIES